MAKYRIDVRGGGSAMQCGVMSVSDAPPSEKTDKGRELSGRMSGDHQRTRCKEYVPRKVGE